MMATARRAYLSLGSNLGDRPEWLGKARHAIMRSGDVRIVSMSRVMETDPVDITDQPRFLNQVLGVDTMLKPEALLKLCLDIERDLGRERSASTRRGPRTIDVDILLYGGRACSEVGLEIPHPRLSERRFFLDLCRDAGAPDSWIPEPVTARSSNSGTSTR